MSVIISTPSIDTNKVTSQKVGKTLPLFDGYGIVINDAITPIAEFWDILADGETFMASTYLRALELAPLKNTKYKYGIITLNGENKGIIYWQVNKFRLSENLNIHTHSKNLGVRLLTWFKRQSAKLINDNILVVGNVSLTGDFGYRFCKSVGDVNRVKLVHEASNVLIQRAKKHGIKIKTSMFKDFRVEDARVASDVKALEYTPYTVDPTMVMHLEPEWKTFDDYLGSMKSKARTRVKRAKKLGSEFEVRTLTIKDIREYNDEIYALYKKISSYSTFNLFTLHQDYFLTMKEILGEEFDIFGVFHEEKFVAFYTTVTEKETMHGHFLGYDQSYNGKYQLYLNMLYWLVERAIDAQVKDLELSRTALEIKSSIGAEPYDLAVYVHAQNQLLNNAMKKVVPQFIPDNTWTPRSPFKKSKEG